MHWRSVLSFVGRTCITAGLLILLFVGYQLWGTGLYEQSQQRSLKSQFAQAQSRKSNGTASTSSTRGAGTVATTGPGGEGSGGEGAGGETPAGDAVAIIKIPKIGVDRAVVEGVGLADLRKGPGHYPKTVLPGERGNAAIAGHRTTYGAPFNRIDELAPGDPIDVTTLHGTFRYRVDHQVVVSPNDVGVLAPTDDARLTLTSCHPKYSAARRIVVVAMLDPNGAAAVAPSTTTSTRPGAPRPKHHREAGLSGVRSSRRLTVEWGGAAALVGLLWWAAFHRRRRVWVWFAGALPFLAVLFVFYANLERILPGNF